MDEMQENYIVHRRPFGEIIYIIKAVKVRKMVDAADGFPYNTIRRGSDLVQYDLDSLKETDLTSFDFDENIMNAFNKSNVTPYIEEIKETILIDDYDDYDGDHEEIRETNLTGDDEYIPKHEDSRKKHSKQHDEGDSEQWQLDTADSICLSTDSGIMNDKATPFELDIDESATTVKFQDYESDFFDTDCEATDFETMKEKLETTHDEEKVKFQDIESDFFETDCEATDTEQELNNKLKSNGQVTDVIKFQDVDTDFFETDCEAMDSPPKNVKFQEIESDFFDEIDENISTPKRSKNKTRTLKDPLLEDQNNLLAKLNDDKIRRVSMTNSLLRSTIDELERALTNSNALLANRDQKIQDLRKRNMELKKSLSEELEHSSQLKLYVMEKDSVVSEKEAKVIKLQSDLDKLSEEVSNLRLYKLNNIKNYDVFCDPINLDCSVETHLLDSPTEMLDNKSNETHCKRTFSCPDKTSKCPLARSKSHTSEQQSRNCSRSKQDEPQTKSKSKSFSRQSKVDETSTTELHATLQMKFMRDAFFYYMIGFHSDEQINAILAILDYGDKRQDFVLEAHKLKKNGKKFSVKKVSTRGLTFVQDIKDI